MHRTGNGPLVGSFRITQHRYGILTFPQGGNTQAVFYSFCSFTSQIKICHSLSWQTCFQNLSHILLLFNLIPFLTVDLIHFLSLHISPVEVPPVKIYHLKIKSNSATQKHLILPMSHGLKTKTSY